MRDSHHQRTDNGVFKCGLILYCGAFGDCVSFPSRRIVVYSARRSLIEAFGFAPILGLVFLFIGCSILLLCWDNGLMVVPISPLFCCFSHCFGLSFLQKWHKKPKNVTKDELLYILFYVTAGIVVAGFFFVKNLDGAGSFFQAYDNGSHLSTIRTFVDTGIYSSLNTWSVVDSVSPFDESGLSFYPSALYCLVAMVITATVRMSSAGFAATGTEPYPASRDRVAAS